MDKNERAPYQLIERNRPASRYARKKKLPIEATHDRHSPKVASCNKCNPTRPGYEHYNNYNR